MKTYNFKARFADGVEHDLKLTTIRARGKRQPPVVGECIRRYTGMRTKKCRWLGDRFCKSVHPLRMDRRGHVFIQGSRLTNLELLVLAVGDGFESISAFREFFKTVHGLPFRGWLIIQNPKIKRS